MAWEPREGCKGRYYTRSVWVNGQVRRLYFGKSPVAHLAAFLDTMSRLHREQTKQSACDAQANHLIAEAPSQEVNDGTQMILHAALTIGGYYYGERHWRRKRHG